MSAELPRGRIAAGIAGLFPGYFALVMATGIVSIACQVLSLPLIARALFGVNLIAYAVLTLLTAARLVLHPQRVMADLGDHARGAGFFTLVAGTCVLGTQSLLVAGWRTFAEVLWAVGLILWLVVMYGFFTAITVREGKPTLAEGINGGWLLATVATQSVAILALGLGDPFGWSRATVAFGALVFFLIGCMLYLSIITLIFYRFTFLELKTASLTPPYWISMGAVAITTLAGSLLILGAERSPLLTELLPFIKGFTLFFWAAGTWWTPLLLLLGGWRHVWRRHPLTYDPQYWGMVFPLGMYTAATFRLAQALPFPPLVALSRCVLPAALLAWLLVGAGLVRSWLRPSAGRSPDAGLPITADPPGRG